MLIKLCGQPFNISIIQTYAPTSDYSDDEIEEYYEEIQTVLRHVKSTDVLIIMGDFNAKVGKGKEGDTVGNYGLGERNERGQRLIHFCVENDLMIANTFFQKPLRKLYTWKNPGDWRRNQIDYILVRKRFRNSIKTCQTYPGADINSDHNPVTAKIKMKLKKIKTQKYTPDLDIIQLKSSQTMQENYRVAVANRYEALLTESQEQFEQEDTPNKINLKWDVFKESVLHANKDIPKREKKMKQQWMTPEILELMSERKAKKNHPDYNELDKKIQECQECQKAKESWINHKCRMIEIYGLNSRAAHDDIRLISGKKRTSVNNNGIKDKNGNVLFEIEDVKNRWCQYIEELFNDERPQAPVPSNNEGPPILACEVENALKKMKDGKAQGEDGITTEMLKVLGEFSIEKLTDIFNDIYDTGHIPDELAKSVYITLPKKSKSIECGDFRTISIMPHVTKLLLKVILERIKQTIETEVGDSQFGFRPGTAVFIKDNKNKKTEVFWTCEAAPDNTEGNTGGNGGWQTSKRQASKSMVKDHKLLYQVITRVLQYWHVKWKMR
ncbi:hypothetical protein EGW08_002240 [Elysia chlorotica]|uniref:Endonuclease/exonuclease/phosphatase domain-containing protein n=1 Tax=Elysia chlorotica TaxID=188477 RepID=A0A433U830_ELYCH|nr:hypothetical protein EGW08_002240 [Elysia chlorotica]